MNINNTENELSKLIDQEVGSSAPVLSKKQPDEWIAPEESFEGQLSVDVFQRNKNIVIKSAIAGVKAEDIDVNINNDTVTVKGVRRHNEEVDEDNYFYKECYWGGFSRSIILPVDIKTDKVDATLENGILTIVLPIGDKAKARSVLVKEINEEPKKRQRKK